MDSPGKMRWVKAHPDNYLEVDDGKGYQHYTRSLLYKSDNEFSKGMTTFQNCLKAGYTIDSTINKR